MNTEIAINNSTTSSSDINTSGASYSATTGSAADSGSASNSSRLADFAGMIFGLDYRSMALLRMGTALAIVANLVGRIPDLQAFYSDAGAIPRTAVLQLADTPYLFSIYHATGNWVFVAALFVVASIFAGMLFAGYFTRFATIASWIMLISLQNRNPMIIDGQDMLLRMMLFWGIFLPWGDFLSVDSKRNANKNPTDERDQQLQPNNSRTIISLATAAYTIQIILIYVCTAIHKNTPEWINGTAGLYSLNIDFMTTPLGVYLTQFPELLKVGTHVTVISEYLCPLLILLPIRNGVPRTIGIAVLSLFHIGLALTFKLGFFPLVNIISLLALLPTAFWERTFAWRQKLHMSDAWQNFLNKANMVLPHLSLSAVPWCEKPAAKQAKSVLVNSLITFFLAFVTVWNLSTLAGSGVTIPTQFHPIANVFRLDQNWFMFAGFAPQLNGWYVMQGQLKNGNVVDVFRNGAPISWERPKLISSDYPNYHWRIYLVAMFDHAYLGWRHYYADYVIREWNKNHSADEQLVDLQIFYMYEGVLPETNPADRNATKMFVWQAKPQ